MEFRAGEGAGIAACVGWATNETENETETGKKPRDGAQVVRPRWSSDRISVGKHWN